MTPNTQAKLDALHGVVSTSFRNKAEKLFYEQAWDRYMKRKEPTPIKLKRPTSPISYLTKTILYYDLETTPVPTVNTAILETKVERVSTCKQYVYIDGGWQLWSHISVITTV